MRLSKPFPALFSILGKGALCLFCTTLLAADWPTFRGSNRTGIAPDTNLLEAWPEGGPKLIWRSAGAGRGYASLAIAGNRIYTLGDGPSTASDANEYLSCFDRATGKPIWHTKTGDAWNNGKDDWQGSRSTPTIAEGIVYVITPFGKLIGCDAETGAIGKIIDLKIAFGGDKGDAWGYSESVLIDGDRLVCTPGKPQATMVALNRLNGEPLWTCSVPDDRGAGHASIVISEVGGKKIYVQTTASGAFAVDAETGKLQWTFPIEKTTAVIPTPIVKGDLVYFVAGYKRGGALVQQIPGPGGSITSKTVFPLNKELANKHGGVVLIDNHLYGCADDQPIIICAELQTGQVVWKARSEVGGQKSAAIVAADGHLYIQYQNGTVALVKADPAGFKEISSFQIPDSGDRPCWAHPVIVDGMLYIRDGDNMFCYDIRKN
ncbi:MAG: PQQ-binding-like beta-propeller repeat protein [Pirellulales bacterium]